MLRVVIADARVRERTKEGLVGVISGIGVCRCGQAQTLAVTASGSGDD
ncbi:hypothetical protein [Mycobacterium tilburgii]